LGDNAISHQKVPKILVSETATSNFRNALSLSTICEQSTLTKIYRNDFEGSCFEILLILNKLYKLNRQSMNYIQAK